MKRRLFTAVLAEALTLPWSSWGAQLARAPRDVYDFFTVYDPAVGPYVCFYWFKDVNVVVLIEVQHYPTGITYYLERRQLSTEEAQQDVRFMTALLLGHAAKLKSTADFRLALKIGRAHV